MERKLKARCVEKVEQGEASPWPGSFPSPDLRHTVKV